MNENVDNNRKEDIYLQCLKTVWGFEPTQRKRFLEQLSAQIINDEKHGSPERVWR